VNCCLRYIFLILTLIFSGAIIAQQRDNQNLDNQIALQYYRTGEYEKAAEVYQKLYQLNKSDTYYRYYLNCLIKLEKYSEAEDLANDQIKFSRKEPRYMVDLGYLLSLQKKDDKAQSIYQQAIKKLEPNPTVVIQLANAFLEKRLYNYAEQTYTEGRKLMKGDYGFQMEMAQVYYMERNYQKMIDEYLDLLKISDMYLQNIQNQLQNAVYNDIDNSLTDILKSRLLERARTSPDITVYSEMLVWLFIQDRNFEAALIQAKSLDLRLHEDGKRIISLARIAADNSDFQTAIDAYQYVINKGQYLEFYFDARNELLEVMYRRVELGFDNRREDYERLETVLTDAIQELGTKATTIDIVRNLAHLKAFYLNKTGDAVFLLEDAITVRGLDNQTRGKLQIELADVYLMQGNVWDATLAYAQVEDENSQNPTGSEAKYRKAKLAYYIGNFGWAQAQLDALKASTEKMTANDAAALSLLIEENTGWDSTDIAMATYSRADLLFYQHKDSLAILTLDSLINNYPECSLVDEAWYLKAEIWQKQGNTDQAVKAYQVVADNFNYDVLADNALFHLAQLYGNQLNDPAKAMEYYLKIITDHSDSIFVIEARKQYRTLRGDKLVN
jgi:tetratricopeptide (TPR) repeat protein